MILADELAIEGMDTKLKVLSVLRVPSVRTYPSEIVVGLVLSSDPII